MGDHSMVRDLGVAGGLSGGLGKGLGAGKRGYIPFAYYLLPGSTHLLGDGGPSECLLQRLAMLFSSLLFSLHFFLSPSLSIFSGN